MVDSPTVATVRATKRTITNFLLGSSQKHSTTNFYCNQISTIT